ncbi:AbrB family transcriptional regulator [Devosia sp.]|uniref:AbrB family transcriptional regulator n=1 Tax=Devosia sp. TaxID=1871048 RepID=UPI0032649F7D
MSPARATLATLLTLLLSAAGGFLGNALGIPAGWIMGGALATSIGAMAGIPVLVPTWLRDVGFVMVGMAMGATVARDSLMLIPRWPVSLLALALELVIIIATTGWMLQRFFRLDPGTAYLSSFPGHLSFVMGIASAGVGNARQIAIIQVIRILMLIIVVPVGALFLPIQHFTQPTGVELIAPWQLLLLAAVCTAAGFVFLRLKVPAAFVLGAMAAATLAKLGGVFTGALPPPLTIATYVMTGALTGSRFAGISRSEFAKAALGGIIATGMTVCIVTAIAYAVSQLVAMPFGQIWLGLSPGALEGMGALGVAMGYDTAFIAAHHVIRLLMLSLAIPAVVVAIRRRELRLDLDR